MMRSPSNVATPLLAVSTVGVPVTVTVCWTVEIASLGTRFTVWPTVTTMPSWTNVLNPLSWMVTVYLTGLKLEREKPPARVRRPALDAVRVDVLDFHRRAGKRGACRIHHGALYGASRDLGVCIQ